MPRSALVVGSVDRASEGAAKECEALLDALESLSLLLADAALLVDEGAWPRHWDPRRWSYYRPQQPTSAK